MSETIYITSAPKAYQPSMRQTVDPMGDSVRTTISTEAEAKEAALAFCNADYGLNCSTLLGFLDAYGYKLDLKDVSKSYAALLAGMPKEEIGFDKWQLTFTLVGASHYHNDLVGYISREGYASRDIHKSSRLVYVLLPGIGLKHKPSYDWAVEANLRPLVSFAYYTSFSLEADVQAKYAVWHDVKNQRDYQRLNLGIGLSTHYNLYRAPEAFRTVDSLPLSLQTRALIGPKASLEFEIEERVGLVAEFSRLTNLDGRSIMGLALFFKFNWPVMTGSE